VKFPLAATALAATFLGIASVTGVHRTGALVGAGIAGLTGLGSILALMLTARTARPVQTALAVVVAGFLLRLALLGFGTVAVVQASASVVAFVVAFFVTFFVFAALEAAYVHTLRRAQGTTA